MLCELATQPIHALDYSVERRAKAARFSRAYYHQRVKQQPGLVGVRLFLPTLADRAYLKAAGQPEPEDWKEVLGEKGK